MELDVDSHRSHDGSQLSVSIPGSMAMSNMQQQRAAALHHSQPPVALHNNQHSGLSQQAPLQHTMTGVGHPQGMGIYQPSHEMDDKPRGRDRSRDDGEGADASGLPLVGGQLSSNMEPTSRKRRRSRKGLDKKFECPHPGCGKSYSRAEHLYRHQLNRKNSQTTLR